MDIVYTDKAAPPLGHYSQAIIHNHTIYLSMVLGIEPNRPLSEKGTIEKQTERAINNVEQILLAAHSSLDSVRASCKIANNLTW